MEFFSNAMRNVLSSNGNNGENNILETNHHLKPVFEKVDTTRYFRFLVSIFAWHKRNLFVFFLLFLNAFKYIQILREKFSLFVKRFAII